MNSRRSFLQKTGTLTAAATFGFHINAQAAPEAKIKDIKVISRLPDIYHGWPTLTRRANGELLVVCSGGRESHVCPFGRVDLQRSHDDGETWTFPRTVIDGPIDDRDAGILETAKGSLLITTFTSLAYVDYVMKKQFAKPVGSKGAWSQEHRDLWSSVHNRIGEQERKNELGQWMIRSTDGGINWSERYSSIVNSPHGPIQLSDGRQFYAGKKLWTGNKENGVCISSDDGQSWNWLADIPTRKGDDHKNYHELHAVEAPSGKLIVQIRNHNKPNAGETLQCESTDGGKTWTTPHTIGVWGLPSFLTRLRDGRLLMTYGHRRKPYGNQARLSTDEGKTWSEPIT
ncbi:MAG: sialidase family protein, partial [Limisphaerales bacterium]